MTADTASIQALIDDLERAASNTILQLDQRIMRKAIDALTALLDRAERAEASVTRWDANYGVEIERLTADLATADAIGVQHGEVIDSLLAERYAIAAVTLERAAAFVDSWVQFYSMGAMETRRVAAGIRALSSELPHVAAAKLVKIKPLIWRKVNDGWAANGLPFVYWADSEDQQSAANAHNEASVRAALEQGETP